MGKSHKNLNCYDIPNCPFCGEGTEVHYTDDGDSLLRCNECYNVCKWVPNKRKLRLALMISRENLSDAIKKFNGNGFDVREPADSECKKVPGVVFLELTEKHK